MRKKITKENLQLVIDCYNQLRSLDAVSKQFSISIPTIYKALKEAGVSTSINRKLLGERIRKYELDPHYFSEIDTRDKAYITGILHSDGCITRGTKQVRIKLTDLDLIEEINSKIYKDRPLYYSNPTNHHKKAGIMVITHHQVYEDVQKHGCCLDKTYNLEFPTTIPDELMGDYFRGFFDGDGCVYINKKLSYKPANITIVATRKWVKGAIAWLDKIGIRVSEYDDRRHDNRITKFTLSDVKSIKKFYEFMYADLENQIYLKRKFEKYKENIEFRDVLNFKHKTFNSSENFKSIPNYENYEAGDLGTIRFYDVEEGWYIIESYKGSSSNFVISLGKDKPKTVQYLVACSFLGLPPTDKHLAIHIDGNMENNNLSNIKWATRKEMTQNSFRNGAMKNFGEGCTFAKLTEETVLLIRSKSESGISDSQIGKELDIHPMTISHITTGNTWRRTGGYIRPKIKNRSCISEDQKNEIKELIKQNFTQKEIANKFHIDPSTVSKMLNK